MGRLEFMTGLLLDTHALVWLLNGEQRLGNVARTLAQSALEKDELLVSAMTFWELSLLAQRQRLTLPQPIGVWRRSVLDIGITEIPVTGEVGILSTELASLPADPADRIITATAILNDAVFVTADALILAWRGEVTRHDAHL
jgi:PIN domain nuclease of toxin-antitoxin system